MHNIIVYRGYADRVHIRECRNKHGIKFHRDKQEPCAIRDDCNMRSGTRLFLATCEYRDVMYKFAIACLSEIYYSMPACPTMKRRKKKNERKFR